MIEVEVKSRARPDTLDHIKALGAVFIGTEHHRDLYFNSPFRDFRQSDEALRIRVKDEGARLTYKGPKLDSETKSRLERTVKIDNPMEMEKILNALGFVLAGEVKKRRTKYALGEVTFALDDVEGLGSFLELEISAEGDWSMQKDKMLELFAKLGLKESICSSYMQLLEATRQ